MFKGVKIGLIASLTAVTLVAAGCGAKPAPEVKPVTPSVGVMNIQKAMQAHPKFASYQELNRQYNTLAAQAQAQQTQSGYALQSTASETAIQGINESLNQEFNAKMADKQNIINTRLTQKAKDLNRELSAQFDQYKQEIDQTYNPQIFSLQLKLKTIQLTKEEMEALQKQLEQLQGERAAKLAAKEKEIEDRMQVAMAPEKATAEQELNAYATQLNASLQQQGAAKKAEIAGRLQSGQDQPTGARSELEQQAMLKGQEVKALQQAMIKEIEDKTAKIASERKLEAVFGVYSVNVTAVDITDAVIAEFKK